MKGKKIFFMRLFITIGLAVVLAGIVLAWQPVRDIYYTGVPGALDESFVHIPSDANFEDVVRLLRDGKFIESEASFRNVAKMMSYGEKIRPGRFQIEPGWNNRELITHLRAGRQAPVMVVLTNERLLENVAGKVSRFIEADSLELLQTFRNKSYLQSIGYTEATLMSLFIPNSYEFYWNTDAKGFVERMVREHKAFWDKEGRMAKAQALGLTPMQVYTLASIVDRETNQNVEKPTIAGVYLNRLRKNMLLQADPTCVFATRDFEATRVTQKHTSYDSPYNTYKYKGLPPGPISMASIAGIDAVLSNPVHKYIFFCAKPDTSGLHNFSPTLEGHNVNVRKFREYKRRTGY